MLFPQDGGLSCVRYYLAVGDEALCVEARESLRAAGRHVGILVCQCEAEDEWFVAVREGESCALAVCGCNGSALPLYIGPPPDVKSGGTFVMRRCECGLEACGRLAIGIGYPGAVPVLGSVDVERAKEVVVWQRCRACGVRREAWGVRLPDAFRIVGDEAWLARIQGLGLCTDGGGTGRTG